MLASFIQSLSYLLPQGYAWPRDPNSTLMKVLSGLAALFSDLHTWTLNQTNEWLPHLTHTRLEEWEAATGLPDPCFGPEQEYEARRGRLLARLRGPTGFYPDSSPAAPGAIEAVCESFGFPADVHYNTPFRVGRDRVGRRLGVLDGILYVLIDTPSTPFRVGRSRVSDRLIDRPPEAEQLACALEAYVPARFQLNIVLS